MRREESQIQCTTIATGNNDWWWQWNQYIKIMLWTDHYYYYYYTITNVLWQMRFSAFINFRCKLFYMTSLFFISMGLVHTRKKLVQHSHFIVDLSAWFEIHLVGWLVCWFDLRLKNENLNRRSKSFATHKWHGWMIRNVFSLFNQIN